jgi:hypothetical protein
MNKNALMITALVAAALIVMKKKAANAATLPASSSGSIAAGQPSRNVNSDMWARLLGDGWRTMVSAQNSDGTAAFLKKNFFGQVTTSDGVPVADGDPYGTDYLSTPLNPDYLSQTDALTDYSDGIKSPYALW